MVPPKTFFLLLISGLFICIKFGHCYSETDEVPIMIDEEEIVSARELAKESWIHSIKDRLLQKLGFEEDQLPNVTQKINLPIPLEQEFESQYYTQADASYRNVKKSERKLDIFSAECDTSSGQSSDDSSFKIRYNLDALPRVSSFESATLMLRKIAPPLELEYHKLRIILYHVLGTSRNGTIKKEMVESRGVASKYEDDLVFVVTSEMSNWSKRKKSHVEFELVVESITGQHVNPWSVLHYRDCDATEIICNGTVQILQHENGSICQPVLIVWTYSLIPPPQDRRKRAHFPIIPKPMTCVKDAHGDLTTNECCLSEFVVDFREIGWSSWIIAPLSFNTGNCLNSCAVNNETTGAIQSLYEPKCTPIEEDLQLMYYKGSNTSEITIKILSNFRIVGCKCSI